MCHTREADDERVEGLRPRVRRRWESPSVERVVRTVRRGEMATDPSLMLASLLSAGMLEAGRAVRTPTRALPLTHP